MVERHPEGIISQAVRREHSWLEGYGERDLVVRIMIQKQNLCFLRTGCSTGKFIKLGYVGTMQKLGYDLGSCLVKNKT